MGPKAFAAEIRNIATKIEKSKSPHRALVAADIRGLLTRLAQEEQQEQQQAQQQQGQQEQQALPKSRPGKNMIQESLDKLYEAFHASDEEAFKKAFDQLKINAKV